MGGRHPGSPAHFTEWGGKYRRLDYINPHGLTWSVHNHIGTPMSHGGDHANNQYSRRHERDPTGIPNANRYEQLHEGDPRGWLSEDAQHGCTRGAHLLVGSFPRTRLGVGSGDLSPSCLCRGAPAWGLRVEHTPMFPGQTIPTWGWRWYTCPRLLGARHPLGTEGGTHAHVTGAGFVRLPIGVWVPIAALRLG
ncbi:hypothetical protein D1007_62216 [Hordeum vulgare]|nr:hypothetical protein D1007_62216 [Hordeum vulgare]